MEGEQVLFIGLMWRSGFVLLGHRTHYILKPPTYKGIKSKLGGDYGEMGLEECSKVRGREDR